MILDATPSEEATRDTRLRIRLLGGFRVSVGSRHIGESEWRLRKSGHLVKLLALTPGHRMQRERVEALLWPELELGASNSLHRTLHTARRVLEPDLHAGAVSHYLQLHGNILALSPSCAPWVDIVAFEQACAEAARVRDVMTYAAALALYRGDLLPEDEYEDWVRGRREALHGRYLAALGDLAELHAARGAVPEAIHTLLRLIATEPANEEARVALMRLYARTGRRYEGLRQYQALREALRRELDIAPSAATQRLYADILAHRFPASEASSEAHRWLVLDATGMAPPREGVPRAGASRDHHQARGAVVSGAMTRFIGRHEETAEVRRLLARARLVTLIGTGGCGKTRLATHVAEMERDAHQDGVWIVPLAAVTDARRVPQAVAQAVGVREEPERPLAETLAEALRQKRCLLVLDNCEHLAPACAALAETLLRACPHLRLLATSRRPLRTRDECAWRVPALSTPDPERLPPFERLLDYDAVCLFVERVAASRPGFALTPDDAALVVRICHRLGSIPLAIELAAGRRRLLALEQIAARLDDALALLAGGAPDAPPRQRTLGATLEWSHELLSAVERTLFRRLAVFTGGWTLEATEAICAGEDIERRDMLDQLGQLVDHSLVLVDETDEGVRFGLLEPIRQFAAERLARSGEEERLRRRHAEWYLALAEEAEPHLTGAEQKRWLKRLDGDGANLRGALAWARQRGEAAIGLRLAVALERFWLSRGLLNEGQEWLSIMMARARAEGQRPGVPPSVFARALCATGQLSLLRGNFERAEASGQEAVALCQRLADQSSLVNALTVLGGVAEFQGDYRLAATRYDEALAISRQLGDRRRTAISISNLADISWHLGDIARAADLYEECLALARAIADSRSTAMSLTNLGKVRLWQDEPERARALLEEAVTGFRELGDVRGSADALALLGEAARRHGDNIRAVSYVVESFEQYRRAGYVTLQTECVEALARIAEGHGRGEAAMRLLGAAHAQREHLGIPLSLSAAAVTTEILARLRAALGQETFERAWRAGLDASPEQLVMEEAARTANAQDARPASARAGATEPLTRREREVAELIAAGLTNREIAAKLGISSRTADTHVGKILAKLDVRSRAAVAAEMHIHPAEARR